MLGDIVILVFELIMLCNNFMKHNNKQTSCNMLIGGRQSTDS